MVAYLEKKTPLSRVSLLLMASTCWLRKRVALSVLFGGGGVISGALGAL